MYCRHSHSSYWDVDEYITRAICCQYLQLYYQILIFCQQKIRNEKNEKNFLTSHLKFVKLKFKELTRMKVFLGLKASNWWCWEKKEGEVCLAPS